MDFEGVCVFTRNSDNYHVRSDDTVSYRYEMCSIKYFVTLLEVPVEWAATSDSNLVTILDSRLASAHPKSLVPMMDIARLVSIANLQPKYTKIYKY